MNNIVIIGGGTAGWLSALFTQKNYPKSKIKVIESTKIGILGAGEGSIPDLVSFLYNLDIDIEDFLKKVHGTKKLGINFENWSGIKSSYIHGFGEYSEPTKEKFSFHFNARLMADFLKDVALNRGVEYIDSDVKDFILENNQVKKIKIEDDLLVDVDFLFDCSGFHRLIPKLYNLKWNSYSDQLLVNTALPYFIPRNDPEMYTTTNSISMKCGWMWQIPLKDRWGCGYIYDKNLLSEDNAKKEVEDYLGTKINFNKSFDFDPGIYETTWVENCLLIGLSSGFLEPLEATSIFTIILQLKTFEKYKTDNNENRDKYNEFVNSVNKQNMLFIRLHYDCLRNDTLFWKNYKSLELPLELKNITKNGLVSINDNETLKKMLNISEESFLIFSINSYSLICNNHHLKNTKTLF